MKASSAFLAVAALLATFTFITQSSARAALITINIGPSGFNIGGINGGVADGGFALVDNFPISGITMALFNNYADGLNVMGFAGAGGTLTFAAGAPLSLTTPTRFSLNDSIDSSATWTEYVPTMAFRYQSSVSPDFGPGSYVGFKTAQGNYGWLEVTWNSASNQFQILSGAYEDQVDVPILAGATGAAVPEPGTWAAAVLLIGGAAFVRLRRRKA